MSQLFAVKDPDQVLAEALALYRSETGVSLAPADPKRLHLHALLQFLAQHRVLINFAGSQSILRDVSAEWIDALAEFLDEARLPATAAVTTLRLEFSRPGPHIVPAGTRASGGGLLWAFDEILITGSGDTSAEVAATCTTLGAEGNGIAPGDISEMTDPVPYLSSVANTTETSGGVAAETTEAFRARLRAAPDAWSVAGPRGAYEALSRRVSPVILDVRAVAYRDNANLSGTPVSPGVARVLVLAAGGASSELLAAVAAALDEETVRPFVEAVEVDVPEPVSIAITGTYYIARSRSGEALAIQAAVSAAFQSYLEWQSGKIGRDINPDELRSRAIGAGAKRLAFSPAFNFAAVDLDAVAVVPVAVGAVSAAAGNTGNGTAAVAVAVGGSPAPGSYRLTCSQPAGGGEDARFYLARYTPTPLLLDVVAADGVAHDGLGLSVTVAEGGVPFASFDQFVFDVGGVPTLAFGGLEDD